MSIEVEHLSVTINQLEILKEIDLSIPKNTFTSIIAPSGAGKSTLLKVLTGILEPSSGKILIDGQETSKWNTLFSYMPQENMLLPWLSVYQNVTLYQKINHKTIDKKQVLDDLALFGLKDYQHFLPPQLSGGMQQRTALLRTMLNPAPYLLLDEPFGSLDAMTRSQMQDWLLSLPEEMKRTTILVTHDIEEAIYLSDQIFVLSPRPAKVLTTIKIPSVERTRAWLIGQAALKQEIYQLLGGDSIA